MTHDAHVPDVLADLCLLSAIDRRYRWHCNGRRRRFSENYASLESLYVLCNGKFRSITLQPNRHSIMDAINGWLYGYFCELPSGSSFRKTFSGVVNIVVKRI